MTTVLVTGTDTGVGKTWVTCALGHRLASAGRKVVAIKPVETGCDGTGIEDGVLLARATGQAAPGAALLRFAAPLAPAAAADAEDREIDFDTVVLEIASHAAGAEIVLLEGAGGLLAPVTWDWNMVDLARELGASAIVVASDRLGTINHTLLTLRALDLAGMDVLGVALTPAAEPDRSSGGNAAAIARLSGLTSVVTLPRVGDPTVAGASVEALARWVTAACDQPAAHS
jgi:dethiobiotin synthetase